MYRIRELSNLPPLAERIRPQTFDDFVGQSHLTMETSVLNKTLSANNLFSMILWGPPGTGKTTLGKILARETNADYFELSAVNSGVGQIRKILEKGKLNFSANRKTILFVDEIHRFNKSQQDGFLHSVENGSIILIGATTENPSFEVISPLLSRCKILKLNSFTDDELNTILERAINTDIILSQKTISYDKSSKILLLTSCGGDARKLLNTLELIINIHNSEESITITKGDINEALQQKNVLYDKSGDYHYDTISAFIKSVRGSDPDAAIYWLAVMLEGGEKPEFIARRLIILASEDIGNAEPYALSLATAGFQAVHMVGMPEASLILSQVTTFLAGCPKSNAACNSINAAKEFVKQTGIQSVPLHLRNAPSNLMKSMDYGKDYKYPHNLPNHFVDENYFPDSINNIPKFYNPTEQGREKFLKERLQHLWKNRY